MALSQSWPGVSGKAQALDIRRDVAGIVIRQGILPSAADPDTPLLNKTSTMIPTVREFHAAIKRTASDGSQLIHNDGPTGTFPQFTAAPQTGSRMDILWVKAFDTAYDPKANVEFGITDGVATTGTAVANRAAMPAGAMELGTLLVPAGATTLQSAGVIWTNTAQFGALRGGPILVRREAELDATLAALLPLGAQATALDTQQTLEVGFGFSGLNRGWYPVGGNMPRFYMERNPGVAAVPGSGGFFTMDTQYVFDSASRQMRGGFTTDTYSKIITIPYDGLYRIQGQTIYASNSNGSRSMYAVRNAANAAALTDADIAGNSAVWGESAGSVTMGGLVQMDKEVYLQKGDRITIGGRQSSGTDLPIPGGTTNRQVKGGTYAMIEYMSPPRGIVPMVIG